LKQVLADISLDARNLLSSLVFHEHQGQPTFQHRVVVNLFQVIPQINALDLFPLILVGLAMATAGLGVIFAISLLRDYLWHYFLGQTVFAILWILFTCVLLVGGYNFVRMIEMRLRNPNARSK
jgi:hypothetical protein